MVRVQVLLLLLLWFSEVHAHIEIPIYNSGHHPFLIVLQDESGGSKKEPGIYRPDRAGNWTPVLGGKVLTGGVFQGVLAQLDLFKIDGRHVALAVVDGKLRLIATPLKLADYVEAGTGLLTLGEGGAQVYTSEGMPIVLPPITRLDDITVVKAPESPNGQSLMISIKYPSPMGDGLTFAFSVNKSEPLDPYKLELAQNPIILNYTFWSEVGSLTTLFSSSENAFSLPLAFSVLRNLGNKPTQSRALSQWKEEVSNICNSHLAGKTRTIGISCPTINLRSGNQEIRSSPVERIKMGYYQSIAQHYDPLKGENYISINSNNMPGDLTVIDGNYYTYPSQTNNYVFLAYFNSVLTFFSTENPAAISAVPLEKKPETIFPDKLSFLHQNVKTDGDKKHLLFVSYQSLEKKETMVYLIKKVQEQYILESNLKIDNEYYVQDELSLRASYISANKNIPCLFDSLTPSYGNVNLYKNNRIPTVAHVSIIESLNNKKLVYDYVSSEREFRLPGIASYKKYNPYGIAKNQSCLEVGPSLKIEGELLRMVQDG